RIRNRNRNAAVTSDGGVPFRRRVQGMQLEPGFFKRAGEFADRRLRGIVEMPQRAKDLDCGNACLRNFRQQRWPERIVDVPIGGKNALHEVPSASVKNYHGQWKTLLRQ